jgi:DnaJ-class molecular chaperone
VPDAEKAAAVKRFQKINEAYSVLRDSVKRQQYDRG